MDMDIQKQIKSFQEMEEKTAQTTDKNVEGREDILPNYSLVVSESEEETDLVNKKKENEQLRIESNVVAETVDVDDIIDSCIYGESENNVIEIENFKTANEKLCLENVCNNEILKKNSWKKISAIVDSESENEDSLENDCDIEIFKKDSGKKIASVSESETECSKVNRNDDNIENGSDNEIFKKNSWKKISTILDSESDDEDNPIQLDSSEAMQIKVQNRSILDVEKLETKLIKYSGIIDSESDDELDDEKIIPLDNSSTKSKKSDIKNIKQSDAILNSINQIKSGTQKMHRDQNITMPYHKPRNLSLKEFMARKSITRPQTQINNFSLKMSENALRNYDEYLRERELESKKMFTSENLYSNENKKIELTKDIICQNLIEDKERIIDNVYDPPNNNEFQETELENNQKINEQNHLCNLEDAAINDLELPKSTNKIQIISNIKVSPAITEPILNIENLKRLILNDTELNDRFFLKGDPSLTIDLGMCPSFNSNCTETKQTGVDELFEKLLKSNSRKFVVSASQNTSKDNSSMNVGKDLKPGANYVELKKKLKKIINKNRLNDLGKRIHNFKKDMEIVGKICDEEEIDDDEVSSEDDHDINFINNNSKIKEQGKYENECDEVESDSYELENENDEDADDESDETNSEPDDANEKNSKSNTNNRLEMFDKNSNDEESVDLGLLEVRDFNESILNFTINSGETENIPIKRLCDDEQHLEEDELMNLCSGNFEKSQLLSQNYLKSKTNTEIIVCEEVNPKNTPVIDALDCGIISTIEKTNVQSVFDSSDEEDKSSKSLIKQVKRNRKIYYSDDDNESTNSSQVEKSQKEVCSSIENLVAFPNDDLGEYDSDERQSPVCSGGKNDELNKLNKKKKLNINEYVENEAELSESDWDSADEDERNLDNYDLEVGDEDEYDQDKLKDELARIHMTKLMDRDASEIKKIEEMLFVDEENHGLVRKKQFKWKTADDNFTLDSCTLEEETLVIDEEDDEEQWRKMKHDREQLLIEKKQESPSSQNKILADNTQIFSIKKRKFLSKTETGEESSFLISKSLNNSVRGSFLNRDDQTLSRVATIFTHTPDLMDTNTVHTKSKTSNNIVFSECPKYLENKKRKSASLECSKTKKTKLNNSIKPDLIEHLEL